MDPLDDTLTYTRNADRDPAATRRGAQRRKMTRMSDTRAATAASTPPPATVGKAVPGGAGQGVTLFVMVVAILYFGREVLVPVTLALLLAFLLAPLVDLLRRLHLGRVGSVLLGVIVALGVVVAIGGVIGEQIAELTTDIPKYVGTVENKVSNLRHFTLGRLTHIADSVGVHGHAVRATHGAAAASAGVDEPSQASSAAPATSPVPLTSSTSGSSPLELAERYLAPVLSPIATFGIVFVVAVFALLQREDLRDRLIRLLGSDDLHRTTVAIDDGGRRLSRYFLTQLSVNVTFGVVIGLGLLLIGVPNPILWGTLSALLRFVPYVGSFLSAALPMALAAAVEPGWSMVLWTAALYIVVEGVTGQVIEPFLYGHSTGLSPFSVVVAAIFWSWIWGPIGLILSTPLTLCLVVMGRYIKRLEFLDVMLGDRPALTPVESFYQRVLAGDADEAQDHAEALLRACSLSSYYDEVALKGLQLAANDAQRGTLDAARLDRVRGTVRTLIEGLSSHEDAQPPVKRGRDDAGIPPAEEEVARHPVPASVAEDALAPAWRSDAAVLCIAGRGPLDDAAAAMLAQLVAKHGLGTRLVSHADVSRDRINELDMSGAAMACISYLELTGSPAHLRYLVQRLRQRLPKGAPILVGLWPSQDAALSDRGIQQSVGADLFTSSLEQTVAGCVEEATRAGQGEGRAAA